MACEHNIDIVRFSQAAQGVSTSGSVANVEDAIFSWFRVRRLFFERLVRNEDGFQDLASKLGRQGDEAQFAFIGATRLAPDELRVGRWVRIRGL